MLGSSAAHKAIKLTLVEEDNAEYRHFTDELFAIYRESCRLQRDGRFSDAGRAAKVAERDARTRRWPERGDEPFL